MGLMISIIIPTYNEAKNIERLLKSLKNQSYNNFEIIVIDDSSSDNTVQISKKYTQKVITRKHSERSVQRNFGAKKSKGEYLLFLDGDMELTKNVLKDCLDTVGKAACSSVIIPEKTVGRNFIAQIRRFEREMYMGDPTIEVARFFRREVFFEFGGYDTNLTGTEDYDLPYRIGKSYKIGRSRSYILHHEENLSLGKLLFKRYYYANHGAFYASKHPELIRTQGNLLFRMAYLRNWRKFFQDPIIGASFIVVRILETFWAITGFITAVGIMKFIKTLIKMLS